MGCRWPVPGGAGRRLSCTLLILGPYCRGLLLLMRFLALLLLLISAGRERAWAAAAGPRPVPPAPADTLRLEASNSGPWGHYFAYCLAPERQVATGSQATARWAAGQFRPLPPGRVLQLGFAPGRLWLRATVVNKLPQRTRFVWSLYEFVDSAALFVQPNGCGPARRVSQANNWLTASKRAFPARFSCLPFWLDSQQKAVLYLAVESRNGSYYLPTDLTTTDDFLAYEQGFVFQSHWAGLLGLYLGSILVSLLLYGFLRDPIHLWYGTYIVLSTWFLLMEDGLDAWLLPQPFYVLGWWLGQGSMLLLAVACQLRVLARFVRLRQGWPRLHRLSQGLSWAALAGAVGQGLVAGRWVADPQTRAWLNVGREGLLGATLLGSVLLLGVVGRRGRGPQRRLARLYGLTYACFLLGSLNILLNGAGLTNIHLAEPNALAWGLALELLGLGVLLTARFRHLLRRHSALRLRHLRERAAADQRLIAAQDEEREALARELHDALAPGLTALHLAWQGRQVRQALTQAPPALAEAHYHTEALLRHLRHDVRSLGQALLPTPAGTPLPLPEAVALLAETLSLADDGPEVVCACDPACATLPAPLQAAAYRLVAELLHNALRHAQARQVRITVRCQAAHLLLVVEDDGRGFDPAQATGAPGRGGLGLRGVQARVGYLRGQVGLRSQPGRGTQVRIELPTA